MVRLLGRVVLCLATLFQTLPLTAHGWSGPDHFCCWSCEPVDLCDPCVDSQIVVEDECGCGAVSEIPQSDCCAEEVSPPVPTEPQPSKGQKPQATAKESTTPTPATETPAPALDTTEDSLPPAPIAVPQSEPITAEPSKDQVLPGPASQDTTTGPQSSAGVEGLFDEPPSTPEQPSTSPPPAEVTQEPSESAGAAGLFDEPETSSDQSADSTESVPEVEPQSEPADAEESEAEESAPAEDPLQGLFGPEPSAEPESEPAPESSEETQDAPFDPFGQIAPPLKTAGGLASREFREWTTRDASARYEARIVRFARDGIVLAQESGAIIKLGFSQLSDADLLFARVQLQAQRALIARGQSGFQPAIAQATKPQR